MRNQCVLTVASYNVSFPVFVGAKYDASITNLTYQIPSNNSASSPVEIILSFLSPITPTSTLRQSIPAAYLTIYVEGTFDIDVYVDLNGQWVSGNRESHIEWKLEQTDFDDAKKLKTWKVKRSHEQLFTEWNDRAEWGTLAFSGPSVGAQQDRPTMLHCMPGFRLTDRIGCRA